MHKRAELYDMAKLTDTESQAVPWRQENASG